MELIPDWPFFIEGGGVHIFCCWNFRFCVLFFGIFSFMYFLNFLFFEECRQIYFWIFLFEFFKFFICSLESADRFFWICLFLRFFFGIFCFLESVDRFVFVFFC